MKVVSRFLDRAAAIAIGCLLALPSPGLSASLLPKIAAPERGAFEYVGISRGAGEDEAAWNAIKGSSNPGDFDAFIKANPGSPYADQAKRRAAQLRAKQKPKRVPSAAKPAAPESQERVGEEQKPGRAPAGPVNLVVASPYADKDFRTRSLRSYADRVSAEANGGVSFVVFSGGELLQGAQIPTGLSENQAALGVFNLSQLAADAPVFSFSSLPFVARSYEEAAHLWARARPIVQRLLAERGMIVLYSIPAVPAGLFAKKDVRNAADLKGLRIGASDDWLMRLVSELGAKPVKTSDGQPGRATANESTDAMFAPLDDAAASKASKGFTTAYDIQASFSLSVVVINQSAYYTLGEEVQRALLNAAVTAQNAAWADSIDERNASVDLLGKENLTVQAPPQALVTELKNASNPLIKSWLAAAGNDGHTILSASDSATR